MLSCGSAVDRPHRADSATHGISGMVFSETGDFNVMHTFTNEGDADVDIYCPADLNFIFGCLDTGITRITVHPSPCAGFTADPASQMMPDRTVNIANTTSPEETGPISGSSGMTALPLIRDPGTAHIPRTA